MLGNDTSTGTAGSDRALSVRPLRCLVNSCGRGVEPATVTREGLLTETWGLLPPPPPQNAGCIGDHDALVVSEADAEHPDALAAAAMGFRVNLIPRLPESVERLLEQRGAVVVSYSARDPYSSRMAPPARLTVYYADSGCFLSSTLRGHVEALRRPRKLGGMVGRVAARARPRPRPQAVETCYPVDAEGRLAREHETWGRVL